MIAASKRTSATRMGTTLHAAREVLLAIDICLVLLGVFWYQNGGIVGVLYDQPSKGHLRGGGVIFLIPSLAVGLPLLLIGCGVWQIQSLLTRWWRDIKRNAFPRV